MNESIVLYVHNETSEPPKLVFACPLNQCSQILKLHYKIYVRFIAMNETTFHAHFIFFRLFAFAWQAWPLAFPDSHGKDGKIAFGGHVVESHVQTACSEHFAVLQQLSQGTHFNITASVLLDKGIRASFFA